MNEITQLRKKISELENINNTLKEKKLKLKEHLYKVNDALFKYKKILEKTKSIVFISTVNNVKVEWSSNDRYFKDMFGEELLNCLDIENLNFIKFIHPDDRALIMKRTLYFLENKGDNFAIIFRVKKKDNNYKWLYLKVNLCNEINKYKKQCICLITEFDESFYSQEQINELNNGFLKEKHVDLLNKFDYEELIIIKYLAEGKLHKQIQTLMHYKDLPTVNNKINKIFRKAGTNKINTFVAILKDSGYL